MFGVSKKNNFILYKLILNYDAWDIHNIQCRKECFNENERTLQ